MINQLNIFSPGVYVVADEWNANFQALSRSNADCAEAITDAEEQLAFPDGDLSGVFAAVRGKPNSHAISGNNVIVEPEQEYYKSLSSGEDLNIQINAGLNAEARILIYVPDDRSLKPFSVNYNGTTTIINHYNNVGFDAGYYYIMIYETNGIAWIKLIWTGV